MLFHRKILLQMAERPEDFNLPVSVVARLLKESLPEGVAVSKEARAALAKAAAIFVLYTTSLSNNFANKGLETDQTFFLFDHHSLCCRQV